MITMTPTEFGSALIAYCFATRGSCSSWGRTQKRNGLVGGHSRSYHLVWLAADVVYDEKMDYDYRARLAARFGLKVVDETDHDHLQPG